MGVKKYKPTTPSRRYMTGSTFEEITKSKPEKKLLKAQKSNAGRNNTGKVTVRHQGAGVKQRYRLVDFKRDKDGMPAKVAAIEYDPNRSARIALLHYEDGEKRYIIAPEALRVGMKVVSGADAPIEVGNTLPLSAIPLGQLVHAIELQPGRGAQMARSAGAEAQVAAKEGKYATLRLPSGEMRMVLQTCKATLGRVGNADHEILVDGKAGRARWRGRRPAVRGVTMNPVDHPHGGGEAKAPIGRRLPCRQLGCPLLDTRRASPRRPLTSSLFAGARSKRG